MDCSVFFVILIVIFALEDDCNDPINRLPLFIKYHYYAVLQSTPVLDTATYWLGVVGYASSTWCSSRKIVLHTSSCKGRGENHKKPLSVTK
jgi:hypothetical protein